MFWLFVFCLLALVIVPPLIALFESAGPGLGSRDVGFWALARAVAGSCHVPWGRQGVPIVRFSLPDGEARIRAAKGDRFRTLLVEMRSYQAEPFRFAGRLSSPPLPPLRWRAPGKISDFAWSWDGRRVAVLATSYRDRWRNQYDRDILFVLELGR